MTTIRATVRAFVAVELPDEVRTLLVKTQSDLRERLGPAVNAVRWVRSEGAHLTLQFLGDVPVTALGLIKGAIRDACEGYKPLTLKVEGLGVFPNPRRPRIIWVGLSGDVEKLGALAASVESQLKHFSYKQDNPFKPHITLGRVRDGVRRDELAAISNVLSEAKQPRTNAIFTVDHVSLMESRLQAGGSVYTQLSRVPLR